jgi:hypothetical protein
MIRCTRPRIHLHVGVTDCIQSSDHVDYSDKSKRHHQNTSAVGVDSDFFVRSTTRRRHIQIGCSRERHSLRLHGRPNNTANSSASFKIIGRLVVQIYVSQVTPVLLDSVNVATLIANTVSSNGYDPAATIAVVSACSFLTSVNQKTDCEI